MSPISASLGDISAQGYGLFLAPGSANWIVSQTQPSTADASQAQDSYYHTLGTDSSDNVYTVNYQNSGNGVGILSKYNKSGVLQWQRKISNNFSGYFAKRALAVDSSGNIAVVGENTNASSQRVANVLYYNSSGVLQWQRHYEDAYSGRQDQWYGVCFDSSGNVIVSGTTRDSGGLDVHSVVKYNSSGTIQWQKVNPSSGLATPGFAWDCVADSSGNIYTTGASQGGSGAGTPMNTAKFNSSGVVQWQRNLTDGKASSATNAYGYGINIDSSVNVYVAGYGTNSGNGFNCKIAKYNSAGTIQWQRFVSNGALTAANQSDYGYSVAVDNTNGMIYVAGTTQLSSGSAGFILKYNSSGTIQWQRTFTDGNATPGTQIFQVRLDSTNTNVLVNGFGKNNSGGKFSFIAKIPADGSKTGTYTVASGYVLSYAASSLTDTSVSHTDSAGNLNNNNGTGTDSAGALVDAAGDGVNTKVTIP